jgi:hypothetical protein
MDDASPAWAPDPQTLPSSLAKLLADVPHIQDVHENFAPKWKGRYLSSNANITVTDKSGKKKSVPVGGNRFSKFKTRKCVPLFERSVDKERKLIAGTLTCRGKKVTAFGESAGF